MGALTGKAMAEWQERQFNTIKRKEELKALGFEEKDPYHQSVSESPKVYEKNND